MEDELGRCEDCGKHTAEHLLLTLYLDGEELLICADCKEAAA